MTDRAQAEPLVPPPGNFLETHERKTCHDHHHPD